MESRIIRVGGRQLGAECIFLFTIFIIIILYAHNINLWYIGIQTRFQH